MTQPVRFAFLRPQDGAKEGGAGEQRSCPPQRRTRSNLMRRAIAVIATELMLAVLQFLGPYAQVAFASQTVRLENGATIEQRDGKLYGTCYVAAVWDGLATTYLLTMPDGQTIPAHCIAFGDMDPADDNYDFVATPHGDGGYEVHVNSDQASYYQTPSEPRVPANGSPIQPVESDDLWYARIVHGGLARVRKASSDPSLTSNLDTYSLAGATFSVWLDESCTQPANNAVLTTGEDGLSPAAELDAGTYWIREDAAPRGFALDARPKQFNVVAGETSYIDLTDTALFATATTIANKVDATDSGPQGSCTLKDAQLTVRYYATLDAGHLPTTPERTWVFASDASGRFTFSNGTIVSGDALFVNGNDQPVLPIGTITLQETQAPHGYYLEGQTTSSPTDYSAPIHTICIDGLSAYQPLSIADLPLRAGISIQKRDATTASTAQGDATLAGISFALVNANQTNVTVGGVTYAPGAVIEGALVTDAQGLAATTRDFLPLGTYEIRETSTNDSYRNTSRTQTIILTEEHANTVVACAETFEDEVVRGGVRITKHDDDLQRGEAQGDATLSQAAFAITLESNNPVVVGNKTYSKGQTVATIQTDEQGVAQTESSDLPFGTYTIREVVAPTGYTLNDTYRKTFSIRTNGVLVDLSDDACRDSVIRGGVRVRKVDHDLNQPQAQGDATLEGAEFSVFLSSPQPVVVNGVEYHAGDVVATMTTNQEGEAQTSSHELPYGTYVVRETMAPTGYLLNDSFEQSFSIRNNGTIEDAGDSPCIDDIVRGGIAVGKVSRETSQHVSQGEATLRGAQFTISLESELPVVVNGTVYQPGSTVCTLTTDDEGKAQTEDRLLPYGTYRINEVEAPQGFLLNEDWSAVAFIREDGTTVDLSNENDSVDDQVMRGGFGLNKVDADTMERMGNTAFRITSLTTGENHIAVTDENGVFHTENYRHSDRTNSNDGAANDDTLTTEQLEPTVGLWFSGRTDMQTEPNDELGALPYDVYEVQELRGSNNKNKKLVTFTVRIHQHDYVADMGTIDNESFEEPHIATTLSFDGTQHTAPSTGVVTLTDVVRYDGLTPKTQYELKGELIDQETGEALCDAAGEPVTNSTFFETTTSSGQAELEFVFDASDCAGKTTVAFEHLFLDGQEVATHADLDDEAQTVRFPSIATTLTDTDGEHEASGTNSHVTLVDDVSFENLEAGRSYELMGSLVDKRTGKTLVDDRGQEIRSTVTFIPGEENGSASVPFTLPCELVQGKTLVAFEQLKRAGIPLATHEDLNDEAQTVTVPHIRTELTDEQGNHTVANDETVTLTDTVIYTNLIPGATYELCGTLWDKSSGEQLQTPEGAQIEARTTFITEMAEGVTHLSFTVPGSLVAGKTLVAYESLSRDGRELAVHADLRDAQQTICVPHIGTTLVGEGTSHEVCATEQIQLTDTVAYEGLQAGDTYRMQAHLMDSATAKPLTTDDGREIVVDKEFVADTSSGTIAVPFTLEHIKLAGTSVVCFETLVQPYGDHERILARHEDLTDANQTVTFPAIATKASDASDGDNHIAATNGVRICDEVSYQNLTPGIAYVLRGTLHNKQNGAIVTNANGMALSAEKTFTPQQSSGSATLEFEVDASRLAGATVVVFESCLRDDVEVAVHANLHDEAQTIYVDKAEQEKPEQEKPEPEASTPTSKTASTKASTTTTAESKEPKNSSTTTSSKTSTPNTGDVTATPFVFAYAGAVILGAGIAMFRHRR